MDVEGLWVQVLYVITVGECLLPPLYVVLSEQVLPSIYV